MKAPRAVTKCANVPQKACNPTVYLLNVGENDMPVQRRKRSEGLLEAVSR
jgi:hypothetical protein